VSGFLGMLRDDGIPVEERFLQEIAEELRFRGADGVSVWSEKGMGSCLAMMRTGPAPQAETQPQPCGVKERFRLWGDLRVDGRAELCRQLAEEGGALSVEASSEEYFLAAWQKWGEGALERVIGDFSVALWDAKEQTLWCARDFIGPRPFYYAHVGSVFCFSNTLDVLRRVPGVSSELDEQYIGDFLLEGWNMEPSRTVYRDIRRLPAGHLLRLSIGQSTVRRFRKLPVEEPVRLKRPEEYVENYLQLLRAAVNDRLPDGATAVYLSGGLDSGAVCAVVSQLATASGIKEMLKAFTVSWKPLLEDQEPGVARLTAGYLGIAHEVLGEYRMIPFEESKDGEGRTPEPILEPFVAREQRQYRRIAEHSNVVLSGDGGDDILGGQTWPYLVHLGKRGEWQHLACDFGGYLWKHRRIPPLRGGFRARVGRLLNPEGAFEQYPGWLNEDFEARVQLRQRWLELRNQTKAREHPIHPKAYQGLHSSYWAGVLETEDAGWTRARLETRPPLLDLRVLQYLLRLPPVPWCVNKELCRVAMKELLPQGVITRPKTPLAKDAVEALGAEAWRACVPKETPEKWKRFVKSEKWWETFWRPKGSLTWLDLRPLSLLKWLESH